MYKKRFIECLPMRVGLTRPNADETDGITSRES